MIIGLLSDLEKQQAILPAAVVRALNALKAVDLLKQEPGRYELEGDKLFYLLQEAMPRFLDGCKTEAHREYADIQLPLTACERFGVALPQAGLEPVDDKFESNDIAFYPNPANEFFMDLAPGSFAFFPPAELHRPCVVIDEQKPFRKVVVKVHRSLLGL